MTKLTVHRTISDTNKDGVKYKFTIADLVKLINTSIMVGDELSIPINVRGDQTTFWESGGRNPKFSSSIGTVITSDSDKILDAILFNKLGRVANGKQALHGLHPGYRLYLGRINVSRNILAPKIKILQLTYLGIDNDNDVPTDVGNITFGKFCVRNVFCDYESIEDCIPAKRLVTKLFSIDVTKPYFSNGWSFSDITQVSDKAKLLSFYRNTISNELNVIDCVNPDLFIDTIEQEMISKNTPRLSSAIQIMNFENETIEIIPLEGLELSRIESTISKVTVKNRYIASMSDMMKCYNPNILFNSDDIGMLKMAMTYDDKYSLLLEDSVFCVLRGYKG